MGAECCAFGERANFKRDYTGVARFHTSLDWQGEQCGARSPATRAALFPLKCQECLFVSSQRATGLLAFGCCRTVCEQHFLYLGYKERQPAGADCL